jgi:hypothetical protein
MNADGLYIVSPKRISVSDGDIAILNEDQDFAFPQDLCDFLQQFGPGEYCGCLFLFEPKDLLANQAPLREIYTETFWFDRDKSALSQEDILQTTWVARTLDGDEIVYLRAGKIGYYVLPRHSDIILRIGNTLGEVLDWFSSSGVMYTRSKVKWFCTFKDRCRLHLLQDDPILHVEALKLVEGAFRVDHAQSDLKEAFSTLFCREISGYVSVYGNDVDIFHDLDFDAHVCKVAEKTFYKRGFRSIEHHRPKGIQ